MASKILNKKIEYWEHQLLDLGKRNKMINYRETKRTTLKLLEPSIEELFERLAIKEETLTFQRSVDRDTDIRIYSILSLLESLSVSLPVAVGDIKTENSILERQRTLRSMAYLLSGQKLFNVDDKQLKNVAELAEYMKNLLDLSYEEFEGFCHKMIDYDDTLDVQLEAWLIALGKRKELDIWRKNLTE